jgi:hypothetical protein
VILILVDTVLNVSSESIYIHYYKSCGLNTVRRRGGNGEAAPRTTVGGATKPSAHQSWYHGTLFVAASLGREYEGGADYPATNQMEGVMSSSLRSSTHDSLMKSVGPIHEEILRVTTEIQKSHNELAVLKALAVTEYEKIGLSKDSIGQLTAACW